MNVSEAKRTFRLQERLKQVQSQRESGLCVRAWCEQRGVKENQYYYWLRDIRKAALQVGSSAGETAGQAIVKVDLTGTEHSAGEHPQGHMIRLQYRNGVLDIPPGSRSCDISAVLKALNGT